MFATKTDADTAVLDDVYATAGAIVMGRRMFDVGFEPWGDPPPLHMPVFVLTHTPQRPMAMKGGTTYTFVGDGIEDALKQAKAAVGDKNIGIWGGAYTVQQYLKAGLLDELQIHLIPILLGEGVRLFEHLGPKQIGLKRTRTMDTPSATHLRFDVVR